MLELITNPNEFFSELKRKDVKIKKPLLAIVLPLAVTLSTYQYILINKLSQAFPKEVAQFLTIGAYIGIISSFIGIFAVWFIVAVMMHGISSFFNATGNFRRTFEFTGYGFLPPLIGAIITIPISYCYISQAQLPKITINQLVQNPNIAKTLISGLLPKTLIYSNLLINLILTAWSLTIWTFAIKHAREIELKKAFITVLIPTAIFAIYQI
ncbi:YIP1 family protein [Archaeoglobus sp.]